jgi:phytoene desaturase
MNQSKKPKIQKKVIVIGSGPGGLGAAMILAHRGHQVRVFEKAKVIGGRNAELRLGEYSFDVGPTFLMMKFVLDELFQAAGRKTEAYLDCRALDPMYLLQFGDRQLRVSQDRKKMKEQIEKIFPGESEGLDRFYENEEKKFQRLYPCLKKEYSGLGSLLSMDLIKALPYLSAGKSLYDVLSQYFKSETLRLAFTFQSKYLGMSPWECPGLFSIIPFTEHAHGVYHVMGGLNQITKSFAKIAKEEGAEIFLNAGVDQVLVRSGRAYGVRLQDGSVHEADEVVVNADFGYAVENLFPKDQLKKWTPQRLKKMKYSCSTFMMYLGVDREYESEVHSIFFAENYRKNIEAIARNEGLSSDFSVYVRNASVIDPSVAPKGHSALYILVPTSNNRSGIDWINEKENFENQVFDFLERRTPFKGLKNHIQQKKVITPLDWESDRYVYEGATFNLGHHFSQLLIFRPHNQFEEFKNCYLVGGGTHPGSGLPTIFQSARIASDLIERNVQIDF